MQRPLLALLCVTALLATAACAGDAAAATNQAAKAQTTCPVMKGNPVDRNLFVDAEGKRIYVCCAGCIAKIQKDPKKYIQAMESEGIVLEKAPAKEK
jgi:hypothetical protein